MVTLHVPKMGAVNFLTSVSIRHKQLKDTVKTDRVSSVKLIMWYVCLNMSAHHGVFLNMFSNKNSVIPRCNRQSGEGRNINHPGSAFPSLVRYDLTACQLQNSESLNSTPRSFHLRYTKQSLSPPSLFSSTWAPHWTSSHKSEPNSQLREKNTIVSLIPGAPGLLQTPGFEEQEGNIDQRCWCAAKAPPYRM